MALVERRELPHGAWLLHQPEWLDAKAAAGALAALLAELAWEQRDVVLFGRRIPQPRLIAWAGDVPYRYSGQTLEARRETLALADLRAGVVECVGVAFNHVLVNRYRNGLDGMGLHADDEPELGAAPVVASVSLGVARRLVIVPRRGNGERLAYSLGYGSLFVMGGSFQEHYRHGVPKQPAVTGERLSLTFRRVLRAPDE